MKLNKIYKILMLWLFVAISPICLAEYFAYSASYDVCFTPGNNCAGEIIKAITQAKQQILVQAYIFTDTSIAKALVKAKKRGVDVRVLFDKSQMQEQHAATDILNKGKIKLIVDHLTDIAHNKIIIIDELIVIGGSYNYTRAAAKKNAENVIIIKDAGFAQKYVKNWYMREQKSTKGFDTLSK